MSIKIAVVQQNHNPGKPEENRSKALLYAKRALDMGADLVVFHEETLAGYCDAPRDYAESVETGQTVRAFAKLLAGSDAVVVFGLVEKAEGNYYITSAVINQFGLLCRYRKMRLFDKATGPRYEPANYQAGDSYVTFMVDGYKAGIMICYDGDFDDIPQKYAEMGCSLLLWPNNRESRGPWETASIAKENQLVIATACCTGYDEENRFCSGASNIVDSIGQVLARIDNEEGIIIADVSPMQAGADAPCFCTQ